MVKDEAKKPIDISKVLDFALDYNPSLAVRDISTVRMWVNEGCDIDLDILPVMKIVTGRKKGISTFSYFTNPILQSRDRRDLIAKEEAKKPKMDEDYYCKIFLWKRQKGLSLSSLESSRLEIWIQKSPTRVNGA